MEKRRDCSKSGVEWRSEELMLMLMVERKSAVLEGANGFWCAREIAEVVHALAVLYKHLVWDTCRASWKVQ